MRVANRVMLGLTSSLLGFVAAASSLPGGPGVPLIVMMLATAVASIIAALWPRPRVILVAQVLGSALLVTVVVGGLDAAVRGRYFGGHALLGATCAVVLLLLSRGELRRGHQKASRT